MFKRSVLPSSLVPLATLFGIALFGVMLFGAAPARAEAALEPVPAAVEFGDVDLHFGGTQQQNVKFTNNSAAPVLVIIDGIAGADAARFQIVGDSCAASFVGAGENCSVDVAFDHGVRGAFAAKLLLDTAAGVVEAPLSASAVTGTPTANPSQLTFAPIPYNQPGSFEGESRESESITIQNSSDAGTQIESMSITGPDAEDFAVEWGNCENNLLWPNNTCGIGVRFRPSAPGIRTASLVLHDDSAAGPIVVPLAGEGLHGPQMTLNTTQAMLGNVPLGSSVQQIFTVGNGGDYPLLIQRAFLVSGTPLMFPVQSDSCSGHILYPADSCTIAVAFEPTALGEKSGSLLFITNTPAITVAGIDGIGVSANEAATVLPPVLNATPNHSASVTATVTASPPAPEPTASSAQAPSPPPTLGTSRPARLYRLLGRSTLDPGADAQCPVGPQSCETLSVILPGSSSRTSTAGVGRRSGLLGSALRQLRGGEGMHVRIPLSPRAAARLRRHQSMQARVVVIVQSGGAVIAQQTWTVTLGAAGRVARTP